MTLTTKQIDQFAAVFPTTAELDALCRLAADNLKTQAWAETVAEGYQPAHKDFVDQRELLAHLRGER